MTTKKAEAIVEQQTPAQHPGYKTTEFLGCVIATVILVIVKADPQVYSILWGAYAVSRGISKTKLM